MLPSPSWLPTKGAAAGAYNPAMTAQQVQNMVLTDAARKSTA